MNELGPIELSLVLPAYNEGSAIRRAVEKYLPVLAALCTDFEIIVIDDGSTDDTRLHAEAAARLHSSIRVLSNPTNCGQAATLCRGFREARGDVVTHNGVDLPFAPEDTCRLLECLGAGADVVLVERIHRQAYGMFRKLISWTNILFVRAMFRSPFNDHNFVQAYRRSVLHRIPIESRGVSTVTTELILKALALGLNVQALKIPYHPRNHGHSSITLVKILHTVLELLHLRIILTRWKLCDRTNLILRSGQGT
jgi:glycosyltransferase involved in cell wall biosynthesis